ncbi:hypothetical protein, partial [Falsigemmobacter intermedius]|uniref:hypothetical protein n=1 Tax=Falsigemmobacter intermedius TaxID=1553448 RepID=UPI003F0A6876
MRELCAKDIAEWCSQGSAAYFGQLRPLLRVWETLELEGFTHDAQVLAAQIKHPTQTDKDGVRTWDPDIGAYRPSEDAALKNALDSAFNEGLITLYDYSLARVFRGLGMRPAQLAAMKCCDLRSTGQRTEIHIPLLKQRGTPERGEFMPWKPITQGLAELLSMHIEVYVKARFSPNTDISLCPLFPPIRGGIEAADGLHGHANRDGLGKRFVMMFERLQVVSPITGQVIFVTPTRERHTVLTGL